MEDGEGVSAKCVCMQRDSHDKDKNGVIIRFANDRSQVPLGERTFCGSGEEKEA